MNIQEGLADQLRAETSLDDDGIKYALQFIGSHEADEALAMGYDPIADGILWGGFVSFGLGQGMDEGAAVSIAFSALSSARRGKAV